MASSAEPMDRNVGGVAIFPKNECKKKSSKVKVQDLLIEINNTFEVARNLAFLSILQD